MTYAGGAAFRRVLEDRLCVQSLQTGVPLVRMRKLVVFDRFLARLWQDTLSEMLQWLVLELT